ncbi:MAG TPA: winged helix-turn-helix domain-containing protein [Pirellulales bacterium]|nr:winged helix-turn-helix domain-containing protein [Pirellulales bacterium]
MNAKATKKAPAAKTTKSAKATKPATEKKPAAEKKPKAKKEPKPKKPSALDAAAKVLGEVGAPMNCQEMIQAMAAKGYWTSPGGQTPHATLYSAILREINVKGKDARFVKTERGKFALKA